MPPPAGPPGFSFPFEAVLVTVGKQLAGRCARDTDGPRRNVGAATRTRRVLLRAGARNLLPERTIGRGAVEAN